MKKASGGDGIPVQLFQILKDGAVKVLYSICQEIWKTPILWPPDSKSQFIRKDPDAGKDRRREEKEMTEDEMVA